MEFVIRIKVPDWLDRICVWPLLQYRRLRFGFHFRRIPLTQSQFAIVDPEDFPALIKHKWSASKWGLTFYAVRSQGKSQIKMHRQIKNAPPNLVVDHIDHNGLNNTKRNLRLCSKSQNAKYQRPRKAGSSGYKGVCWHNRDKCWHVRIHHNGRNLYIGSFKSESAAARAYDKAALKYHKDFACLNFPSES